MSEVETSPCSNTRGCPPEVGQMRMDHRPPLAHWYATWDPSAESLGVKGILCILPIEAWRKALRYHRHARVENVVSGTSPSSGTVFARRSRRGREVEASLACRVLNWMSALGRPESSTVSR
jgi:hypothetical protein